MNSWSIWEEKNDDLFHDTIPLIAWSYRGQGNSLGYSVFWPECSEEALPSEPTYLVQRWFFNALY